MRLRKRSASSLDSAGGGHQVPPRLRPADLEDRDAWPEQFAWIEERLQSFNATFRDCVKRR